MTGTQTAVKKDTTYNGWPNRETWNVMLWMDNEEGAYRYYRDKVNICKERKLRVSGVRAKNWVETCFGDSTPDGIKLDSSKIRWGRIAEAMREES